MTEEVKAPEAPKAQKPKKAAAPKPKKTPAKKAAPKKRTITRTPQITIDKNVPFPNMNKSRGQYPFEEMQPGDSFLVKGVGDKAKKLKASLNGAARRAEKKTGAKFYVDVVVEEKGVRVWRVDVPAKELSPMDEERCAQEAPAPPKQPEQVAFPTFDPGAFKQ